MTYKQIETSREIRLWIGQVIVPAAIGVVTILSIPDVKEKASEKLRVVKQTIKNKFKKD